MEPGLTRRHCATLAGVLAPARREAMHVELNPEETDLLRQLLLAEVEGKRVEIHHARNADYKAELQRQERLIQGVLKRLG
jgi:hypothetical protein